MAADGRPLNTVQITDKEIAHLAIGYMKIFYRYRERKGQTETQFDVKSESGLIADGFLTFDVNDEKKFTATLEATDYWHRNELRYRHTIDLLVIDSLTLAMMLAIGVLGWYYFNGHINIFHFGIFSSLITLILSIIGASALIFILLWPHRRYRYIYAIEQFKKYFADDQWIGFGFDVFPNYENRYFRELRRQCIRYGVGLLEVDSKGHIKTHLSPARTDAIKSNRELVEFKQLNAITTTLTKGVQQTMSTNVFQRGLSYFPWQNNLLRFQRTYYNQLAIIGVAMLLIAGLIYEELQQRPINYVDEDDYMEQQISLKDELEKKKDAELFYFKVDSGIFVRTSDHYIAPYIAFDQEQAPISLSPPEQSLVAVYEGGRFVDKSCEAYAPITRGRYIIFFTSYYNLDEAKQSATQLRLAGIPANVGWAECFFSNRPFYLVFLETFYNDQNRAQQAVRRIAGQLKEQNMQYETGYSIMTR